jgi:hypothetical protein
MSHLPLKILDTVESPRITGFGSITLVLPLFYLAIIMHESLVEEGLQSIARNHQHLD